MVVRFGFVAMAMSLSNASPSQTMTVTRFKSLKDREAALRKITNIASSNIMNSLRVLRHAYASGIVIYRFSSKLIPLFGHPLTEGWDFFRYLEKDFAEVGQFIRQYKLRVSFHPEHFTILNSPREDVVKRSIADLERHVQMLEAMGLDERAKLVMHVGGGYQNKQVSLERFRKHWSMVPLSVRQRLTLENDDKIFTAKDTLTLCQSLGVPMVFDVHHHRCNGAHETPIEDILEPIINTWKGTDLPPKIHISSPKSTDDFRSHADYVDLDDVIPFLNVVREYTHDLDIMIEAKQKDEALYQLVDDLTKLPSYRRIDGGSIQIDDVLQ